MYFKKTWMKGNWPPKNWNYFEYIGRRTNNDIENFNKHTNVIIHQTKPSIFKFINFIKSRDSEMYLTAQDNRENPTHPSVFHKS